MAKFISGIKFCSGVKHGLFFKVSFTKLYVLVAIDFNLVGKTALVLVKKIK